MYVLTLTLVVQAASVSGVTPTTPDSLARSHGNGRVVPTAVAVRATQSPVLDGILDDEIWQTARAVGDFTQVDPRDGDPPSERTEVRIAYDGGALYVGARMYDSDPASIASRLGRRDQFNASDNFTVVIDSYHDHRTAWQFRVNPAGVREDRAASNDGGSWDDGWDPVWEVATRIDSLGWVAEMRIPFSQLRYAAEAEPVWGINFTRFIFRRNEFVRWAWTPKTEQGFVSLFGHLVGLRDLSQPRRIEVMPYTLAKTEFTEGADRANPFNDGSVQRLSAGVDLKYGVTSNVTLNATINPDFGQVEADPAVVNLSAFETFFQERRPFFIEGAQILRFGATNGGFAFGAPQLFYSRRVGRSPSRSVSEPGGYTAAPNNSTILGAAKLTGQSGGWSLGFLDAVTAREYADVQASDGAFRSEPIEPLTNYAVATLRRDLRGGASGIGFMGTAVHRDLSDPVFAFLRSSAYTGGMDFFHRFAGNQFAVNGTVSGSLIRGDSVAIISAQRSSARYYQRPDQDYVAIDSTATSLSGYAASIQAGKVSGKWTYGTDFFAYSPGFEVNDAGFQTQTDRVFHGVRVSRRWLNPVGMFQRAFLSATASQQWNFGGDNTGRYAYLGGNVTFRNYWNTGVNLNLNFRTLSDKMTRGGPLMTNPQSWNVNGWVGSDGRKPVQVEGWFWIAANEYDGWGRGGGLWMQVRPSGAVTVSLSPSYERSRSIGGYVSQRADPTATATFGRRYVFAELEQTTVNVTLRTDLALSPGLSVQLYAQPFASSGDYVGFKELARPGTFEFVRYGETNGSTIARDDANARYTADPDGPGPAPAFTFGDPDFLVRSLRANLVLRWEYLPGSTLFLVWNHNRSGFTPDPAFQGLTPVRDIFRDDQQNTLLVKVSYWLNL